jgi:hypothetical protein
MASTDERRKTVQRELLSALRRRQKLEEKIERLRAELRELGRSRDT